MTQEHDQDYVETRATCAAILTGTSPGRARSQLMNHAKRLILRGRCYPRPQSALRGFLGTMGILRDPMGIAVVDAFGVVGETAAGAGPGWGAPPWGAPWPVPSAQPSAVVPGQRETTSLMDSLELVKAIVEMVKDSTPAGEPTSSPEAMELKVENERFRMMISFREQMDAVVGPMQERIQRARGRACRP